MHLLVLLIINEALVLVTNFFWLTSVAGQQHPRKMPPKNWFTDACIILSRGKNSGYFCGKCASFRRKT